MRKTEMHFTAAALAMLVCTAAIAHGQKDGAPTNGPADLALQIADFAAAPITGSPNGTGNNAGALALRWCVQPARATSPATTAQRPAR